LNAVMMDDQYAILTPTVHVLAVRSILSDARGQGAKKNRHNEKSAMPVPSPATAAFRATLSE